LSQATLAPLKLDFLDPVLSKGRPGPDSFAALDRLASTIAERHAALIPDGSVSA